MSSNFYAMTEEDKKWRRRDDARILSQAEAIKADKQRMREAQIGAREILEEEAERTKGLEKVASGYSRRSNKATVAKNIFTNFRK